MHHWSGKWALVTGASAGIGLEFARLLAAGKSNLILSARRADRLNALADDLRVLHEVSVETCPADLAEPEAPRALFDFAAGKGIPVDLLINNAGFGAYGAIHTVPLSRLLDMVQVNCSAVLALAHLFLQPMVERRRGDILIVASTAGFQAVPYNATYAATKSFDLLLAEALAYELRPRGIRVCALCPGPTSTEFHSVSGSPVRGARVVETPEKVVRVGLEALASGKSYVISGGMNNATVHLQRIVPRSPEDGAAKPAKH
jgi:short-subunit dehydrogenase